MLRIVKDLMRRVMRLSQQENYEKIALEQIYSDEREGLIEKNASEKDSLYFKDLLASARTQWQFGDWQSLVAIDRAILEDHPNRATLALLIAAGHSQLGDTASSKTFAHLAKRWGCSNRLIAQIIISGVHNSLGRAAASKGNEKLALGHFAASITTGVRGADMRLLTQARVAHQLTQMRQIDKLNHQSSTALQSMPTIGWEDISVRKNNKKGTFSVKQVANIELGEGWAGNTINTVIFRHHGILTLGDYQYTAFYVDDNILRIVKRNLINDKLKTHDIIGKYNLKDAHNSISMGHDRRGYIHLTYDHHSTSLRYIRSLAPHSINEWSQEMAMTGAHEERVTYPTFILPRHGHPLTLLYRDGTWNKGSARLKTYDEEKESWVDNAMPILSGADDKPWTCNAYWNHPALGNDGSLHLSFVWRTHSLGENQLVNNINISYACSRDNGLTWLTCRGRPYQLPITPVNAEVIYPVSPGTNLINQCGMALDSNNRPHIAFYSNDESDIPQYQHLRFDGLKWCHQYLSERKGLFNIMGGGTLKIPISRPDILIDDEDNAYIIYRGDLSDDKMTILKLNAPNYLCNYEDIQYVDSEYVGYAEPVIDRVLWSTKNILSIFMQRNDQPDHDINHKHEKRNAKIIDLVLKDEI